MLVHLAASLDNWDPKLLDLIAKEHYVFVLDLPGVGVSQGKVATTIPGMAEQTIAIISDLGYNRINLLGLSMGGMIAQEIVRMDSDLVNSLILAGVIVKLQVTNVGNKFPLPVLTFMNRTPSRTSHSR